MPYLTGRRKYVRRPPVSPSENQEAEWQLYGGAENLRAAIPIILHGIEKSRDRTLLMSQDSRWMHVPLTFRPRFVLSPPMLCGANFALRKLLPIHCRHY